MTQPQFRKPRLFIAISTPMVSASPAMASVATSLGQGSITDTTTDWPTLDEIIHVLMLGDYNTRLVVLATAVLGLASGLIGTYLLLRKRSLMGDALAHATLPGIAIAFMIMVALGGSGKFLPGLLLGAAATGLLGVGLVLMIRRTTRIKDDAALGIALSVTFGMGIALIGIIQDMQTGSAAGINTFIYGKTASIIRSDLLLIVGAALLVALLAAVLYKEFAVLCFDESFAAAQGWPVLALDVTMMALVTIVTVIGLQAVGLILMVALLIIPPAAARFWTEHLGRFMVVSALIGGASGWLGATLSALVPRLPAGAIIVVAGAGMFVVSLSFGVRRGALPRLIERWRLVRTVRHQHLLRALYEAWELRRTTEQADAVRLEELMRRRSWSVRQLRRGLRWAKRNKLIEQLRDGSIRLTVKGRREASRMTRNHRLWELFLITHADIAPSHVDRDADQIEHVLGRDMVRELENHLRETHPELDMPESPHTLRCG